MRSVCAFAVLAFLLLFSGCMQQEGNSPKSVPRTEAIPQDAMKILPQTDSYPPIMHSQEWENPIPLPEPINTAGAEDSSFITWDGNTLYFFFTPDVRVPPQKQLLDGATGIYFSRKQGSAWTEPERIILSSDLALDGCEFVQANTMWFCSARAGNLREIDLYTAEYVNGQWTNWKNAGEKINLDYDVGEMHISSDGSELYYHSSRAGGKGGMDIWLSRKVNGQWTEPENVAAVNSEGDEGWSFLSADGSELWFTRFYMGSPAIFRSTKINGGWSEPEMIISQFAGEPSLDSEGNLYFVHHFYQNRTMVEADIYMAMKK